MRRGALIAAATFLLAGCTSSDPLPRTEQPVEEHAASGTITFGVLGEPATLDPYHRHASDLTVALTTPLYPSLFRLTPDGEAAPYLAASIEKDDDGVVVELADMRWSDGQQITPADVIATWKRAHPPSGLARFRSARVQGGAVRFEGDGSKAELALATRSPILPDGRAGRAYGGPFALVERTPGLEVRMEPNPEWSGDGPGVERLVVQHIASLDIMLGLLEEQRLDAAAVPSSVNLSERLERSGVAFDAELGWESIAMTGSLAHLAGTIDRGALESGLIGQEGRISDTPAPRPGDGGAAGSGPGEGALPPVIPLAVPEGDELMFLLQRAITLELAEADLQVELWEEEVPVHYGPGTAEGRVSLVRLAGDPLGLGADGDVQPLFHVETFIAFGEGISGIEVNPTVAGPLWNVERWTVR